jgi:4-amino-4-deoxy-L-arabinose transferase-like glycosyltransferase
MAATVAALFVLLAGRAGVLAGAAGALALLLNPPFFAHAHIAATDTPVSCFFLLSALLFLEAARDGRFLPAAVLCCGLGLASKASFVLFPALLVPWLLAFGDRTLWRRAAVLAFAAPVVMMALCPMWWAHPIASPLAFWTRVAHAGERWQVDAFYLGQATIERTPWHSGLVLAAATTPPLTLLLAVWGGIRGLLRRDRACALLALGALALPLSRVLPNAPSHDGARLLMPSLYCLAPLAGIGLGELSSRLGRSALRALLLAGFVGLPVVSLLTTHPFEMSYYSECLGGLRGAYRLGFETSYWFDALTPEAREKIQALLPEGARLATAPRYTGYPLLRAWGLWRQDIVDADLGEGAAYLLLYSRRGYIAQVPSLRRISEEETPLFALKLQEVPLLRLYRLPAPPSREGSGTAPGAGRTGPE